MRLKHVFIAVVIVMIISFTLTSTSIAVENPVSPKDAQHVALAWLYSTPDFQDDDRKLLFSPAKRILEIKDQNQDTTVAFVLELAPKGFIIVTPSYDLTPIIAFSNNSNFDQSETSENILLYLLRNDISERLTAIVDGVVLSTYREKNQRLWNEYLNMVDESGKVKIPKEVSAPQWDVTHGPFLTSVWGQSTDYHSNAVFNFYTPPGPEGSNGNYVSGCVATALGQILNYYEWPITGTGTHSYMWNNGVDPPQTLSADFKNTAYNWATVLDDYTGGGTTLSQRQAAGIVTYHAGVAVNMNYASSGSGASVSKVDDALENYFRFSGEYVTNSEDFYLRLYNSILAQRPAELGISGNAGGHAVVVDGVQHDNSGDTTRYYHLNMGWNGYSDAWYDIASGFTTDPFEWTVIQGAVLDIVPNPDVVDPGTITSNPSFLVSWDVSPNQGSCYYELQQLFIPGSMVNFADGAENGGENWEINGFWGLSSYYAHNGSYAYKGHINQDGNWFYPGTMTFTGTLKIDPSTSLSYYWGTSYGQNLEMRLEISTDGVSWEPLESHTDSSISVTWHQENVTVEELSSYVGDQVQLRFVVDYLGGSVYIGNSIGFYIDDFMINNGFVGSWELVDDQINSTSRMINVYQNGDYSYRVRANCSQWYNWSDIETIEVDGLLKSVYIPLVFR